MRHLPRYLVSAVHFTTTCVLLFFLIPRRTGAYRQRNVSGYRTFNTAVDFGADREQLEAHMRQHTRSFCTCGNDILQSRFCKQDFGRLLCSTAFVTTTSFSRREQNAQGGLTFFGFRESFFCVFRVSIRLWLRMHNFLCIRSL